MNSEYSPRITSYNVCYTKLLRFREVRKRSGLRGRLERLQGTPELVADVGHNPDGIRAMLESWTAVRDIKKTDLVFGVLKSKDLQGIFSVLTSYNFV